MRIMPYYFVEPEVEDHDCHNYVCKWLHNDRTEYKLQKTYIIVLRCHEEDSDKICRMLNTIDPWGEEF